jgi:hypothetical protein
MSRVALGPALDIRKAANEERRPPGVFTPNGVARKVNASSTPTTTPASQG